MSNRFRKFQTELATAQAIIQQFVENKQDDELIDSLRGFSSRQKRMLASELTAYQREINLKLHEELSELLSQLQESLDSHFLGATLTDYTESLFFTEHERAFLQTTPITFPEEEATSDKERES